MSKRLACAALPVIAALSSSSAGAQPAPPPGAAVPPPAAAPATPTEAPGDDAPVGHRMNAGQLDIRATASTDILLADIGLGASADFGLVPIGPGVLSLGGGFDYQFCGSVCWLFSALTPLTFSQFQLWPQARAAYHLGIKNAKNLDIYPLVTGGPVFARAKIEVDNGLAKYTGTDVGFGVSAGVGMNLFVAGPVFIGGEAKVRYAKGSYSYELTDGNDRTYDKGSVDTWSLTGIEIRAGVGVRLP